MPAELNGKTFKLKYLFRAVYEDGSVFEQDPEDKSTIDPKRSAFYDVLNAGKRVVKFALMNDRHFLEVDLKNGLFSVDWVEIHPEILPPAPVPLDLIFFRQHQIDANIAYKVDKEGKPIIQSGEEVGHRCKYFLGWECTINGKGYKQVLGLS